MGNLAKRIITAVILIPLVVLAVLELDWRYVGAIFGVILLAGAWEWGALAGCQGPCAGLGACHLLR